MDTAYDLQKAGEIHINLVLKFNRPLSHFIANQLEVIALERLNSPHSGIQISRIASVTAPYEVIQTGNVWRLVHRATETETPNESSLHYSKASYVKRTYHRLWKDLGMLDHWLWKLLASTDLQQIQYRARQILVTKCLDNRFAVINLQQNISYCCWNTCSIQPCSGKQKIWTMLNNHVLQRNVSSWIIQPLFYSPKRYGGR